MMIYRRLKSHTKVAIFTVSLLLLLVSALLILLNPSMRTGPFGIGLPAPMTKFKGEYINISMNYPNSWVANETPQGDHGDDEILAGFFVPGRGFPHVLIASREFSENKIDQVVLWGEKRARIKYPNYTQLELNTFSAKHNDGWYRKYSGLSESLIFGSSVVICCDYYLLSDTIGYSISFCSMKEDWPQVEKIAQEMMDSLLFSR